MGLSDGVDARWGLDELSGNDIFDSFGSLDGVASGAPVETTIKKLGAASRNFSAVNAKINFGNVLAYERTDSFSFGFWFYPTASVNNQFIDKIINAGLTGYEIGLFNNRILFSLFGGSSTNAARILSTQIVILNAWNCGLVRYDGSSSTDGMSVRVNNIEGNTVTRNTLTSSIDGGYDLVIGERPGTIIDFSGYGDEIVAWSRYLSDSEADDFWNFGAGQQVLPVGAAGRRRRMLTR